MNPQNPDILPMNIGLAPEPREIHVSAGASSEVIAGRIAVAERNNDPDVVLKDTRRQPRPERVRVPADDKGPSRLVLAGSPSGKTFDGPSGLAGANGKLISATPEVTSDLIDARGETLNSLTWPTYLAWRKTKTRPFDYLNGPALATVVPEQILDPEALSAAEAVSHRARERSLEEIDQATLEFIGEVAELGELFTEHGPTVFWGNLRDKLIDECGDILFCATWAFDAWGANPLAEADDLELMRVTDENELTAFAAAIAGNQMGIVLGNARFVSMLGGMVFNLMLSAQTNAGLTANAFKKLRYQRRAQDVEKQIGRIANVLIVVNQILIVANSSVEEALKVNMRKLDARRPGGYNPAVPGGIRTGEGA